MVSYRNRIRAFWLSVIGVANILTACSSTADGTLAIEAQQERYVESISAPSSTVTPKSVGSSQTVSFETDEGTWMSVDVSPAGETIVFDLLGDLYLLSIEGGDAVALTSGTAWDQGPRFSPDGKHVYFISDRVGFKNLWRISLSDQTVEQITRLDRDLLGTLNWTLDGNYLLVGIDIADISGEVHLHTINPSSGAISTVERWTGPSYSTNSGKFENVRRRKNVMSGTGGAGGSVFFSEAHGHITAENGHRRRSWIYEVEPETTTRRYITPEDAEYSEFKPHLSHNGNLLAYFRQYDDRRTELCVLDRQSQRDRVVARLDNADDAAASIGDDAWPSYAFTPDDEALVFSHAGKIRRVGLSDGVVEIVPFRVRVEREVAVRAQPAPQTIRSVEEAKTIRWPSLSRDRKTLVFAAVGYVWVMDTASGDIRRLTDGDDFEFMPAISPDGLSVAYISYASDKVAPSWQDYDPALHRPPSRLMVTDVDGQQSRQVLSSLDASFALPEWSDDATKIALLRYATVAGGVQSTVGWTNVSTGDFNDVMTLPNRWVRGAGGYHYSRWVGFDRAGENLLFSYPVSTEKSVLAMADLAGDGFRILAIGAPDVGGINPSPNLTQLILTRRDNTLWLAPFALDPEPRAVSTLTQDASQVSENGGLFVEWHSERRLSFGFGREFYDYDLHTKDRQSRRVSVPITRPTPDSPVAFEGAHLITLADRSEQERIIDNGVLVVDQGRITAIGPIGDVDVPEDAVVVDVTGKTIVPGFIDTHYHGGGFSVLRPHQYYNETTAIEYGVTTAWNPGHAPPGSDGPTAYVDLHTAGRVIGPRWSYSSGVIGHPYPLLVSDEAALANVERFKELGTTVMKEYTTPTRDQQRRISNAARHHDLGVVAHIQSYDGMITRIVDGYTGADHQFFQVPFFEDMYQLLFQTGFIWTPDLNTTYGSLTPMGPFGAPSEAAAYVCRAIHDEQERNELGELKVPTYCDNVDADLPLSFDEHRLGRMAKQAAEAARRGVKIGVSGHNVPAVNLHLSMWAHWRGGMPAEDVLRATSLVNAEKLGLGAEIGTLEVGKVADFVVLDGNPLDNILNTMSIDYTIQGGVIFDADSAKATSPVELQRRLAADAAANDDDALPGKTGTDG